MADAKKDNPAVLYTMSEAAAYCGRSLSVFRKHYRNGVLPDPMDTSKGVRKKRRRYTLQEVKNLKEFFRAQHPGRKERKKKRA